MDIRCWWRGTHYPIRIVAVTITTLTLCVGASGAAAAAAESGAQADKHLATTSVASPKVAPAPIAQDAEVSEAMAEAVGGDTVPLERLLASLKAPKMRTAVQEWLVANPIADPDPASLPKQEPNRVAPSGFTALGAGSYDHYCTGYNGATIGWNNKTFRACHGTLNVYISGRRVGKYYPDVYPPGDPVTVACAKSLTQVGMTVLGLTSGGATNALGWTLGTVSGGWGVLDVWQNCKRR